VTIGPLLVLGSASPRRREILTRVGIEHRVVVGDADEAMRSGEAPLDYLKRVVLAKLDAVSKALPPEVGACRPALLVADTTVILDGRILGKPEDEADRLRMILALSGKTHEVATRFVVALADPAAAKGPTWTPRHAETAVSRVTFRDLTSEEARAYAASGEGTDKAGGYAVQERASGFVSRIEGSYTNVVGLPAAEVIVALRRLGLCS
jgi:septum formation protein